MSIGVRFFCQSCGQGYRLDPSKIPPEGKKARCRTCAGVFIIAPPGTDLPMPGTKGPWALQAQEGQEDDIALSDLKSRIRFSQLFAEDRVLAPGAKEWLAAGQVPLLQKYFRLKESGTIAPASSQQRAESEKYMCTGHPEVEAKFACYACKAYYCQKCVEEKRFGATRMHLCPKCKEATPDVIQPVNITPFWLDLGRIFTFPFHAKGWITFVIFVLFYIASDFVGNWGVGMASSVASIILWLPLIGYLLHLIKESAKGVESPPEFPDFGEMFDGMVIPAVKFLLVSVVAFLPILVFLLLSLQIGFLPWAVTLLVVLFGIVLGFIFYPMVLAILSIWGSVFSAINPVIVFRLILRIKKEYSIFLLFWYGLWILIVFLTFIAAFLPFFGYVLDVFICYIYFVTFHMLGRMCYQTEEQLAWE